MTTKADITKPHGKPTAETLPPKLREAWELQQVGLSADEIATKAGCSIPTAYLRLRQAREMLGVPKPKRKPKAPKPAPEPLPALRFPELPKLPSEPQYTDPEDIINAVDLLHRQLQQATRYMAGLREILEHDREKHLRAEKRKAGM